MDGIIFDVDGTLWDARAAVAEAWENAAGQCTGQKMHVSMEVLTNSFGLTTDVVMERLFPQTTEEQRDEIERICRHRLLETLKKYLGKLYPGVEHMLQVLAEESPVFIVSNCQKGYIETLLESKGLEKYVTAYRSYGDTGLSKAANIQAIMTEYQLRNAIYVGDMEGDAMAAREAGIPILHVTYGFGTVKNADYSADTTADVVDILKNEVKR